MAILPHPPVYLEQIRPLDIWFLLAVGALWELSSRACLLLAKKKPVDLLRKESALADLQRVTKQKQQLGPSAFVETSKLERQVLSKEKELAAIYEARKKRVETMESKWIKYGAYALYLVVFCLYYGTPLLTVDDSFHEPEFFSDPLTKKTSLLKIMLFPVSYVGMGTRVSKWSLPRELRDNSIGALLVVWSSQVMTGKLMDAADAYLL